MLLSGLTPRSNEVRGAVNAPDTEVEGSTRTIPIRYAFRMPSSVADQNRARNCVHRMHESDSSANSTPNPWELRACSRPARSGSFAGATRGLHRPRVVVNHTRSPFVAVPGCRLFNRLDKKVALPRRRTGDSHSLPTGPATYFRPRNSSITCRIASRISNSSCRAWAIICSGRRSRGATPSSPVWAWCR